MPERSLLLEDEGGSSGETPRHGYRGRGGPVEAGRYPAGLTIAISREAGGASIAKRAGARLGWQVYSQELLEYMAQEGTFRQQVIDQLPEGAAAWVQGELERVRKERGVADAAIVELARMVLSLSVSGEAILLGRGAGSILPRRSTLHVRLVAPLADRIAYMSQWLRLTEEEAAEQVRRRDTRRAEFLSTHFASRPGDIQQYDMVLNTSLLGEEACTEIIVQAAKLKLAGLHSA